MQTQQFREKVYQSMRKRADAILDLVDALTVAGHVDSPVALSEETPFRRKFSSIFDTLRHGEIDFDLLLAALYAYQPPNSEELAGCEVYGLDCTPNEREEAETLEDRGSLKAQKEDPVRYGHKYSWLARLVNWGASWVAPVDVRRVDSRLSDSEVGALQVAEADLRNPKQKVIVADSLYGNHIFLAVFLVVKNAYALVRLRSNLVFYERPKPHGKGKKGAPAKHGAKFKLSEPPRTPDRTETFMLGEQTVKLQAWQGLHFKKTIRVGRNGPASGVLASGWNTALQTSDVAVLDGSRYGAAGGTLPDVSVEICNRAFLPLFETAHGFERKPVNGLGEYRQLDVVVRLGVLATASHARRCQSISTGLVSG
jgi:hypothetical protein